jgi:hypothetical protein
LNEECLPLTGYGSYIYLPLPDEAIDNCVLSNRTDYDRVGSENAFDVSNSGAATSDPSHVRLQVMRSARHARIIVGVYINAGESFPLGNGKAAGPRNGLQIARLAKSEARLSKTEKTQEQRNRFAEPLGAVETLAGTYSARAMVGRQRTHSRTRRKNI